VHVCARRDTRGFYTVQHHVCKGTKLNGLQVEHSVRNRLAESKHNTHSVSMIIFAAFLTSFTVIGTVRVYLRCV